MSIKWFLGCERCNDQTQGYNHRREALIEAAEKALPAHYAKKAGFDIGELYSDAGGIVDVGEFVAEHAPCNAFVVWCEYDYPRGTSTVYPLARPQVASIKTESCKTCHGRGLIVCPECRNDT